VVGE
jgi:hypothetical protein